MDWQPLPADLCSAVVAYALVVSGPPSAVAAYAVLAQLKTVSLLRAVARPVPAQLQLACATTAAPSFAERICVCKPELPEDPLQACCFAAAAAHLLLAKQAGYLAALELHLFVPPVDSQAVFEGQLSGE